MASPSHGTPRLLSAFAGLTRFGRTATGAFNRLVEYEALPRFCIDRQPPQADTAANHRLCMPYHRSPHILLDTMKRSASGLQKVQRSLRFCRQSRHSPTRSANKSRPLPVETNASAICAAGRELRLALQSIDNRFGRAPNVRGGCLYALPASSSEATPNIPERPLAGNRSSIAKASAVSVPISIPVSSAIHLSARAAESFLASTINQRCGHKFRHSRDFFLANPSTIATPCVSSCPRPS
jgi:hypothetical protein